MKHAQICAVTALTLLSVVSPAAAQGAASTAPATPTPREEHAAATRANTAPTPLLRTERNSLTLLFTGVGLVLTGLGGLGGGYAGTVTGRRNCDAEATSAAQSRPSIADSAAAYDLVYSRCTNDSDAIAGGTAAMIAGGAFTAIGTAFIVAGAWRVTVPVPVHSAMVPKVDVGMSSIGLRWAF